MQDDFYATVKNVRHFIMHSGLVFHIILLSLTLLLYETVIAVLLISYPTRTPMKARLVNCSRSECERACQQVNFMNCEKYEYWDSSALCILTGANETSESSRDGTSESSRDGTKKTSESSRHGTNGTSESSRDVTNETSELSRDGTNETSESSRDGTHTKSESSRDETGGTSESSRDGTNEILEPSSDGTNEISGSSRDGTNEISESSRDGTNEIIESSRDGTNEISESSYDRTNEISESSYDGSNEISESSPDGTNEISESSYDGTNEISESSYDGTNEISESSSDGTNRTSESSHDETTSERDDHAIDDEPVSSENYALSDPVIEESKHRHVRNAYNQGLEENVDKLWHDLSKYQSDKQTLKAFEKLVVEELKTKSKEIKALQADRKKQADEIAGLKQVINSVLTETSDINKKIEDVQTGQVNQQHQLSGLEFSDEKLTAGMGKLIVQTEELANNVKRLNDASEDSKQRIGDLETLTHQLHASVETLIEEQKVIRDVVEKVAVLSEKTSVISDRIAALQEHQVVSEKEMTNIKATMEKLVKTMQAVDESQMRVSARMNTLAFNVSDHDVLMKELLIKQTRDGRKLHKDMTALIAKSTEQTQAFEELKAQTSQTSGRFNALTASIAKVSERNDNLRDKLEHLAQTSRKATEEFQRRTTLQSDDIQRLSSSQQSLMNQLSKLGNDEIVLASQLKEFPNLVSELSGDLGRIRAEESQLDNQIEHMKSEMEGLKIAVSNVQTRESIKPVVLTMNNPDSFSNTDPDKDAMEKELQLIKLQELGHRWDKPPHTIARRDSRIGNINTGETLKARSGFKRRFRRRSESRGIQKAMSLVSHKQLSKSGQLTKTSMENKTDTGEHFKRRLTNV